MKQKAKRVCLRQSAWPTLVWYWQSTCGDGWTTTDNRPTVHYRSRLTCCTTAAATASIITANPGPAVSLIIASSSQRRSVSASGRRGASSSAAGGRSASLAFVVVERANPRECVTESKQVRAVRSLLLLSSSPAAGSARAGFPGRPDRIAAGVMTSERRRVHWAS